MTTIEMMNVTKTNRVPKEEEEQEEETRNYVHL